MRELLDEYERLSQEGPVGRAVVTRVWGSAPRRTGATLLATADGRMAGSVSGGCVETAVVEAVKRVLDTGRPELLTFAVSDERAWEVGLACGGTIDVFVEPEVREEILAAAVGPGGVSVATVIAGPRTLGAPDEIIAEAVRPSEVEALRSLSSCSTNVRLEDGDVTVFLEIFPVQPTIVIVGAVHVAEVLVELAKPLGYRVIVTDGRAALLTRNRFPKADELLLGWPDETLEGVPMNDATALCILSHDPKFDDPALRIGLRSSAGYIGAIGSKKTQASRRERLLAEGFTEADVARLHGPIGLDLGAQDPAEIALAILAEITAVRHRRANGG